MSLNEDFVPFEAHEIWYKAALEDKNRVLYMGVIGPDEKVGVCRFDVDAASAVAEASLVLNPSQRNKGLSSPFLRAAIDLFLQQRRVPILATIKKVNIGSIKCFKNSGFEFSGESGDLSYFKYSARL